jgi:hypothetical protein
MTKRFGRAIAVTLTAGVALCLAGCGDQHTSGPGYATKDKTVEANGDAPLGRTELISAAYDASMKAGSVHLSMTMKGGTSTSAEGDVSYGGGEPAMTMTMSLPQVGSGKIEMRHVDRVIYMQIPGLTKPGKFVAIDPKDKRSPLAKNFAGLTDQMDPLSSVKSMESAVTRVDHVGPGTVDGASVDHYRVAVDTAKMLKKLGQPTPEGMPKSLTYDMWLDDQDLIRKMSFDVAGTSVEMLLSKWGQPVKVQRPAAGDIMKTPGA